VILDPEFDRSAITASGFETCSNSVSRKLSITIDVRRKFLFIGYWGKFAKTTIVRPPGNPVGFVSIKTRKRCRGTGRRQYRAVLRGLAAFSDGTFGGAAARSNNEPRITC